MANTSRGRFTPPAKTTRAKHTRKTTPTSPSWRFTNKPSRLVTFGGGDVTPSRSGVWAGKRRDGHMARFAFEALGIELTEGQPDTSANKANEKKSRTMKKLIAAAGIGAALTIAPWWGPERPARAAAHSSEQPWTTQGWHEPQPASRWSAGYRSLLVPRPGYSEYQVSTLRLRQHGSSTGWGNAGPARRPRRRLPLLMRKQLIAGALGAAAVAAAVSLAPSASRPACSPVLPVGAIAGASVRCRPRQRAFAAKTWSTGGFSGHAVTPRSSSPYSPVTGEPVLHASAGPVHGLSLGQRERSSSQHPAAGVTNARGGASG